jgi:DNA-binding protein HU-beta
VTKSELVEEIAERAHLGRQDATRAVDAMLDIVLQTLSDGGEVAISGFGRFHVSERGARRGVNPRTGERIEVPVTLVPRFTPGSNLKQAARASAGERDRGA